MSRLMVSVPHGKSPIRPRSSIGLFRSELEAALAEDRLNPHLVLAYLLERGRTSASRDPIRRVRVISILIRGEKVESKSRRESVFLHVPKPRWDEYALVGSIQGEGESDEDTARMALAEDLETPPDLLDLRWSGVEDEHEVELTKTRGVFTDYAFNVFTVEGIRGELRVRGGLKEAWFTIDEIYNQISSDGRRIMTRPGLVQRLHHHRDLNSVPCMVTNPRPFAVASIRSEARDVVVALRDAFRESRELARALWLGLLSRKWRVLLVLAVVGCLVSLLVMRPVVNESIPWLTNVAAICSVILFLASLAGIIRGRRP